MSYLNPASGVTASQVTLLINTIGSTSPAAVVSTSGGVVTGIAMGTSLTVLGLQDVTINAANDVFTWTQLDSASKLQVPTTATNSIAMNIVLDDTAFYGTSPASTSQSDTVAAQGIFGLSRNKTKIAFALKMVDGATPADGSGSGATSNDRWVKGQGYITGLAPKISADQPVWVSPITITVTGDLFVAATTAT
jgi:hypothetical protein